jgi:hypothetical protein
LTSVAAARAETSCTALPGTVDRLACGNVVLTEQLAMVERAFAKVAGDLERQDRLAFTLDQENWKSRPPSACDVLDGAELAAPEKRDCIARMINARLDQIEEWRWSLGRNRILLRAPEAARLCERALARGNIRWRWTDRWRDSYEIGIAPGFSEPAWQRLGEADGYPGSLVIQMAVFDFDNSGAPSTVFSISAEEKRIAYQWVIVTAADEADSLQRRLQSILKSNDAAESLFALAVDLQFPLSDRARSMSYSRPYRLFVREDGRGPTLKSRLYAVSNNETYDGSRTRSRVVLFEGKSYVLAGSVGNTGGASVAVFRPRGDDGMTLICSHQAIPSQTERQIGIIDKAYACPVGLQERRVPWRDDGDTRSAVLDLPEWGGRRPVVQWSGGVGPELRTRLAIGGVGAPEVDISDDWLMSRVDEDHQDSVALLLTEAGAYVEAASWIATDPTDDRPTESLYYRIVGDSVIPVCKVTEMPVAPPGYALAAQEP